MKNSIYAFILLFLTCGSSGFAQVIVPAFHGAYASKANQYDLPPQSGGSAICDGSRSTTVVPITSSTGKVWMDRNLGASRAGISSTDFEGYGCLYQWGRGNDGHASISYTSATAGTGVNASTSTLATTDISVNALFITNGSGSYDWRNPNNDSLWQGVTGINNPCPSSYRVPTNTEVTAEFTAYSITNAATAYSVPLSFV